MAKFKIGDRITATYHRGDMGIEKGVIVSIVSERIAKQDYLVRFINEVGNHRDNYNEWGTGIKDGRHYWALRADQMKHTKIRNTKLAKRVYPNHKVLNKDWIEVE